MRGMQLDHNEHSSCKMSDILIGIVETIIELLMIPRKQKYLEHQVDRISFVSLFTFILFKA